MNVLARFGSAARGDPLYEVGVQMGRLLRTVFLADYFVNLVFRRELLRVLNRGEATNALKRVIYAGRVAVPRELMGRVAPTRTEGINMRGVFNFAIERYSARLMPSRTSSKAQA